MLRELATMLLMGPIPGLIRISSWQRYAFDLSAEPEGLLP